MVVNCIQLVRVWRSGGRDYLATKVCNQVFALLRRAGISAPDAATVRVKVSKSSQRRPFPVMLLGKEESF